MYLFYLLSILSIWFQVLFFENESKRAEFVDYLRLEVNVWDRRLQIREMREQDLLEEAVTREQRAQIVEAFFRHAFSQASALGMQTNQLSLIIVLRDNASSFY